MLLLLLLLRIIYRLIVVFLVPVLRPHIDVVSSSVKKRAKKVTYDLGLDSPPKKVPSTGTRKGKVVAWKPKPRGLTKAEYADLEAKKAHELEQMQIKASGALLRNPKGERRPSIDKLLDGALVSGVNPDGTPIPPTPGQSRAPGAPPTIDEDLLGMRVPEHLKKRAENLLRKHEMGRVQLFPRGSAAAAIAVESALNMRDRQQPGSEADAAADAAAAALAAAAAASAAAASLDSSQAAAAPSSDVEA